MERFVKGLSCNFAEMIASSPFISMFLATNLRQVIDDDIEVMLGIRFHNMSCDKSLDVRHTDYINYDGSRNMNCAN